MENDTFPGQLLLPTFSGEISPRTSAEQPRQSLATESHDDGLRRRHGRASSITPTEGTLTHFFHKTEEGDDNPYTKFQSSSDEQRVIGQSFVDEAFETPRIPIQTDPEKDPTSEVEIDVSDPPTAPRPSWYKRILRQPIAHGSTEDTEERVRKHFPPRAQLKVHVVDFFEHEAKREIIDLANIEEAMKSTAKPEGALVRWVHVPLGVGLFHSSVEDIFLKGPGEPVKVEVPGGRKTTHWRRPSDIPRGRDFTQAGRAGWPYLETEILNVRSAKEMGEARDAARALLEDKWAQRILNKKVFFGFHKTSLVDDVKWRSLHLGKGDSPTYWDTVFSDLPLLLTDGSLIMKSPAATKQNPSLTMDPQTLQKHDGYKDAYIARDSFRCFHRADGFLLSTSPSKGIDYLDQHLPEITADPKGPVNAWRAKDPPASESDLDAGVEKKRDDGEEEKPDNEHKEKLEEDEKDTWSDVPNPDLSVIAHIFAMFEKEGTQRWQYKTAEWLMVFLLTELSCTPHSMRSGYSIATILDAYEAQVSKLKERKFEKWKSVETPELFHSYLKTIDELRTLSKILEKKLNFLERLHEDCLALERGTRPQCFGTPVITMVGRVEFAIRAVGDLSAQCNELHTDLTFSLDLMSRIRTIEQNDLSVSADVQGRAILVLSVVTMLFLPLSFVAALFSMNVQGFADTPPLMTGYRFGQVCAVTTGGLIIIILILLWRVRTGNNLGAMANIWRGLTSIQPQVPLRGVAPGGINSHR